jgi:presenilin-like A22 family membrane protease
MEGLGIQKIPVSIRFIVSNSSDSVKVNVSTTKGMIKPDPLYVSYNKPAIFYLRSEGLGDIVISAASNNLQSNSLTLKYVFPWHFLLASIGGGLLGSFTKYYMNQETKKFSMKPIIGGTLLGFLGAVVYYALGINLIGFNLTADLNEFAVLGFSALCAYFGFRV